MTVQKIPGHILPVIVLAQFCCTSLWFAGNAVLDELTHAFTLPETALPHITSAVQFGFITGTLVFAVFTIADRFSPSRVFMISALLGAVFNSAAMMDANTFASLMTLRFLTGFFLAGIYPVGMKIAADYYTRGLGKSLGFLVGALVLGTAFPHLLNVLTAGIPWKSVLLGTSLLAVFGGVLLAWQVPDGPGRKAGKRVDLSAFFRVFRNRDFRASAFGYFGHMWELYAFWAFLPVILLTYEELHPGTTLNISLWSFLIIGIGSLACVSGGIISGKTGTAKTAFVALSVSGICCLLSPLAFQLTDHRLFLLFLFVWGFFVIMDSPLFSTLVAQNADEKIKGTALTIVNCIGFCITIFSIQLLRIWLEQGSGRIMYAVLFLGPLFGLISLFIRRNHLN